MKTNKRSVLLFAVVLLLAGLFYYYRTLQHQLPDAIAVSNGRIEAQTVDVATRSGGRVQTVDVEEGSMVSEGDIVATLDLNYMAAQLEGAKANVRVAMKQEQEAAAGVAQAKSARTLTDKEYTRLSRLVKEGAVSRSRTDQALSDKDAAKAAVTAAEQRLLAARESVSAARAEVDRQQDLLQDKDLKAPRAGRVLYKLVEPGEVVANGGKVVTLIDLTDVYLTAFYPTEVAGKLRIGDEARIVVDAMPDVVIPAYISYVSPEAQFTPRQVETKNEREKMTFRVKVRIPAPLLKRHLDMVKTGVPGDAYVRTEKDAPWPDSLTVRDDLLEQSKE